MQVEAVSYSRAGLAGNPSDGYFGKIVSVIVRDFAATVTLLPKLYIAYRSDLAEGSEVFHNTIRERWLKGETDVVEAMGDFAHYAQEVRDLLVAGRGSEIGLWVDKNFDRRRSLYPLSEGDIEMVERTRSVGASGKFCGSGGAIVGTYEDDNAYGGLEKVFHGTGTVVLKPTIAA